MSFADVSMDALEQRKNALDTTLINLAMAGLPLPVELQKEFSEIQNELAQRHAAAPSLAKNGVARSWTDYLGRKFGSFTIEYLIEEGLYWFLFQASADDADPVMIKIAKSPSLYGLQSSQVKFPTRSFAIDGDVVREIIPAANALLQGETNRLATMGSIIDFGSDAGVSLSRIDQTGSTAEHLAFYRCPCFGGNTLRELLVHGSGKDASFAIVSMFSQIASALDWLAQSGQFEYHGNLKPDNIVLTAGGVYFRELGDFAPLLCQPPDSSSSSSSSKPVLEPEVRTTTPQYYPWLDVDDIGALGICLWEALTDYHPFDGTRVSEGDCLLSAGLRALIDLELSLSNTFVLPLLKIKRPHQFGVRTTEKLEFVLFKSLKMHIGEDGRLYEDPGYETMAAFNADLLELLNDAQMIF